MGFTIPNAGDATHAPQAQVDSKDLEIVLAAFDRTFVVSGCGVTPQGAPNMTVAVAGGSARISGVLKTVIANAALAVGAAHATLGRFDLVTADTSGVVALVAGTPAATPVYPAIPASRIVLAAIYVQPVAASIAATNIVDKRVFVTYPLADVGNPPVPGTGQVKVGVLTGTIDGANKVFTIPEDYVQGSFVLYIGGIMVHPPEYSLSGAGNKTVTLGATIVAPVVGEWVGGTWQV